MVGAFIAGAVMESEWFNQEHMDLLRHHVLMVLMPVFFLSTGLRTNWQLGCEFKVFNLTKLKYVVYYDKSQSSGFVEELQGAYHG
jgi:Kef-type K+ transport system membrane component KefB